MSLARSLARRQAQKQAKLKPTNAPLQEAVGTIQSLLTELSTLKEDLQQALVDNKSLQEIVAEQGRLRAALDKLTKRFDFHLSNGGNYNG